MAQIGKEKQIDILLQTIDRYWNQAIQNENQRANFTNYILVILGVIQGYIFQRQFDKFALLPSIIIILLSALGALITAKYYERFREQASRVGRLMEKIKEIEPEIDLEALEEKANLKHKQKYPKLLKIRLHKLWLLFYFILMLVGLADLLIIFCKMCDKVG